MSSDGGSARHIDGLDPDRVRMGPVKGLRSFNQETVEDESVDDGPPVAGESGRGDDQTGDQR